MLKHMDHRVTKAQTHLIKRLVLDTRKLYVFCTSVDKLNRSTLVGAARNRSGVHASHPIAAGSIFSFPRIFQKYFFASEIIVDVFLKKWIASFT